MFIDLIIMELVEEILLYEGLKFHLNSFSAFDPLINFKFYQRKIKK